MKIRTIALALVALGGTAVAQPARDPAEARGAELVTLVAADMRTRLPMEMGPTSRLVAVRANGATLIQTFEVPADQFDYARDDAAAAARAFREGFCRTGARILFERGVALQIEVTDGTRAAFALPPITDCPPLQ